MIKQLGLFMLLDVKGTPEEVCVLYTINFYRFMIKTKMFQFHSYNYCHVLI